MLDPVDRDVIGCVYLYPSPLDEVDVRARSWVRRTHANLDKPLRRAVRAWLDGPDWPFERSTSPRLMEGTSPADGTVSPRTSGQRDTFHRRYSSRRVSSTVSSSASHFAVVSAVTPMTSCKYSATRILPDRPRDHEAVAFALRRLPGPRPEDPGPFPRHRASNWRPTPSPRSGQAPERVIRPVGNCRQR